MMKFKKHGFVLLPAVLSIFILGLLGVSLASIYSDTFATLSAGKAASSAQQFAQIEAEYLKTLGFDEAATGKHTWNTMEKFVGDADGKEWESQVEHVRHMQVSEDNAVDIYKISVRKKGDKTSAYSVEIPLSSQSGGSSKAFGDFISIDRSWKATHSGFLIAGGSDRSSSLAIYVNGVLTGYVTGRDYGTGTITAYAPVNKGDIVSVGGSVSFIIFRPFN